MTKNSYRFAVIRVLVTGFLIGTSAECLANTFYIDAGKGNDSLDGLRPEAAWRSLARVNRSTFAPGDKVLFRRGQTWRGQLVPYSGNDSGVITYGAYGEGAKPIFLGSVAANQSEDWQSVGDHVWGTASKFSNPSQKADGETSFLSVDVGNIIFDHGKSTGVKKWSEADLHKEGDFFYDAHSRRVKVFSTGNPALCHKSIELALCRHIINENGKAYVTYENLDLRYGAAHGIGGSGVKHIVIRGCNISFIGGGHQFTDAKGRPVRYGNGIEFWSSAHDCLVEDCRIWEIYDAALTNQGDGTNVQENITYRRNVIWNSEYSFEYWNRGASSLTRNVVFEQNTCVDAGHGWGHGQRPDPNGRHLMFYNNTAVTTNFFVRNNIFSGATDSLLRLHGRDWTGNLNMDDNCWFQSHGPVVLWLQQNVDGNDFEAFMHARKLDFHSLLADPQFVDPTRRNYHLRADSPARRVNGQLVGAFVD